MLHLKSVSTKNEAKCPGRITFKRFCWQNFKAMQFEYRYEWVNYIPLEFDWTYSSTPNLIECVVSWSPNNGSSTMESRTLPSFSNSFTLTHYFNQNLQDACRKCWNNFIANDSFERKDQKIEATFLASTMKIPLPLILPVSLDQNGLFAMYGYIKPSNLIHFIVLLHTVCAKRKLSS